MSAGLEIRPMTGPELETAIDWAAAEGWNPGLSDAGCFRTADPGGFLVALEGGVPVASISVVAYGPDYGFLGFYIVRPDRRGRGIGWALWQEGLAYLGERTVGLDGVVEQQDNYRKSGFAFAHRNVRYGGVVSAGTPEDSRVRAVEGDLTEAVIAYDRAFFAGPREPFLRCWLKPEKRKALALVEEGAVTGYGVVRQCREGFKIGPLFADHAEGAEALFLALAAEAKGAPLYLDPPEPNEAAVALCRRHGLEPVFETARMYKGAAPELPIQRTFGITTFELG